MRVPFVFNRLRTVIMTSLALLILSAMLLIHVVMAKFAERDLVNAHVQRGRLLLQAVSIIVFEDQENRKTDRETHVGGTDFRKNVASLLRVGEFSGAMLINGKGLKVFSHGYWGVNEKHVVRNAMDNLADPTVEFSGKTWGLFWLAPEKVVLASPLWIDGRLTGSVAVFSNLKHLYGKLRESETVVLAYIGMNTLILVLFGIYLLSRTVVRPINRLLAVTERFDGAIPIMQKGESPNSEIGRLSQSLNLMLRQLDANEKKLKENISSLEAANREIKKAQDEIVKSEKMASVGRLATGVAHEIGNPLGIILGYIELLQRGDLNGLERRDFLFRVESEITRINSIIRDLLDFSRPSGGEQKETHAHQILEEVLTVLSPQPMFEQIHIRRSFYAESDRIRVAQDSLKQVFLNVIINAADAMDHNAVSPGAHAESILTLETLNEEGFLIIRVSDTGYGMPADEITRIFDPFFTTKEPGKGTGLGLSICYTMMERAGGKIRAESEPGKGTTLILEIPLGSVET